MSNELLTAFIEWLLDKFELNANLIGVDFEVDFHTIVEWVREDINGQDTTEQQALNYFIDQYDSLTQS